MSVADVAGSGIGLAFIAFPTLISQAPVGALIGVLFFGSLVVAGLQMIEPLFMRFIVDRVLLVTGVDTATRISRLNLAGAVFLAAILAQNLVNAYKEFRQRKLNTKVMLTLRRALFLRFYGHEFGAEERERARDGREGPFGLARPVARERLEEGSRIRMARPLEDLGGAPLLHDLPGIHHADAVADILDHAEIVRNEQVRDPELALDIFQQVQNLGLY
mgnify:CR=1 FL=1